MYEFWAHDWPLIVSLSHCRLGQVSPKNEYAWDGGIPCFSIAEDYISLFPFKILKENMSCITADAVFFARLL